jgi:guanyl-specific ribonuclease Sa
MKDNRMRNLKIWMFLTLIVTALVGCQQQDDAPLPTMVDLNATNEALAVAQTETAIAPTATSLRPTLPPTFTPTPDLLPSETPIPTLDPNISPTPEGYQKDGTIYYNYNGDSIARILPDGSLNEIIITFGIDQPITDLTASPNGQLLAFVAPGSGSGREVWVSNRDGSYLQQVSCLGFAEVRSPSFAPDNNRIAFFAAPLATTNMELYVADFAGSNDCPTGNNQQQLHSLEATLTGDITWNASGDLIYYNARGTYVYDFEMDDSYIISTASGFGTDFNATYNMATNQLLYLRATRNLTTGEEGGAIMMLDDADTLHNSYNIKPVQVYAQSMQWSKDNESVLYATHTEIIYYELLNNFRIVLQTNLSDPLVTFAPNYKNYVYTIVDPDTAVPQLQVANRLDDRDTRQITFNPEGTIQSVLWLEG